MTSPTRFPLISSEIRTAMIFVIEFHQNPNPAEKNMKKPVTLHKSRIRPDIPLKGKEKENQRIKSDGDCRGYVIVPEGTLPETNSEFAPEN